MKILVIAPRLPFPPIKGDRLRTYNFIRQLSACHKVDLCTFYENDKDLQGCDELKKYCRNIETILLSPARSCLNVLLRVFNFKPFQVNYYASSRMRRKIQEIAGAGQYDIVHIVLQRMMPYSKYCGKSKIVLDQIDALSLNMKRRAIAETNILKKAIFYFEYFNMRRFEARSRRFYDMSIVTSIVDKMALEDDSVHVIPNGVDTQYFAQTACRKDIDIIFTGNMGYFPNIDASIYLCREIMPKVIAKHPNIKACIAGTNPAKEVEKMADNKNIFVTGYVNDIREYLNRADIFVAPLRSGSGIQNKILEAMSCSLPVITNSYGNSGICAVDNREVVLFNDSDDCADKIDGLLNNPEARYFLSKNARTLVETKFSWRRSTAELESLYEKCGMKKSNLLIVMLSLEMGGSENVVLNLVRNIDRSIFNVQVCCIDGGGVLENEFKSLGIPLHFMNRKPAGFDIRVVFKLIKLLKREKIDIIHTHHLSTLMYAFPAAKAAGIRPIVHTEHSHAYLRENRKLFKIAKFLYRKVDKVAGVCLDVTEFLRKEINLNQLKVVNIFNGIDLSRYSNADEKQIEKNKIGYGFKPNDFIIGTIGRLVPVKNQKNLILAFKLVAAKNSNLHLIIVGEGELRNDLETLISANGLSSSVHLFGNRRDVPELLGVMDVFALPSWSEGLSLTLLEAMAAMKPIIASNVGGNKENIDDMVNGLLVPPQDIDAMANKIMYLVANGQKRREIAMAAHASVSEKYSAMDMAKHYADIYVKVS